MAKDNGLKFFEKWGVPFYISEILLWLWADSFSYGRVPINDVPYTYA